MNAYPFNNGYWTPPFGMPPIPNTSEEAKKLYKWMRKQEQRFKKEGDGKKDDKKGDKGLIKSPFNTIQWLVLSCFFGPILTPWFILGVITSWQTAAVAIKASLQ